MNYKRWCSLSGAIHVALDDLSKKELHIVLKVLEDMLNVTMEWAKLTAALHVAIDNLSKEKIRTRLNMVEEVFHPRMGPKRVRAIVEGTEVVAL